MSDRLGRLLTHPLRHRLLLEYTSGPDSPSRVARRLGEPLNVVSYHTGVLVRHGYLALVRTERRRGALRRTYRATIGPVIEDADWTALPEDLRRELTLAALSQVGDDARRAAHSGGFEHRAAHLTRTRLELDRQGLIEVARRLRAVDDELGEIAARSRAREGPHGEAPPYEVVVLGFENPAGKQI